MSSNLDILEEKKNPLIDRLELKVRIEHFGKGTPNRLEIKSKIAALKNADEKLVIVRYLESHYGKSYTIAKIHIYDDTEEMKYFTPFHIKIRNLEKDKRAQIYDLKKKKEPYQHLFEYN